MFTDTPIINFSLFYTSTSFNSHFLKQLFQAFSLLTVVITQQCTGSSDSH